MRAASFCFACALVAAADAQTLDEQYRLFLRNDCAALEWERDASNRVAPGQAGPVLADFCIGPPPDYPPFVQGDSAPGVTTSTSATGGAAGAAAMRAGGRFDEAVLRDRREQARNDDPAATVTIEADGSELFDTGRAAAFVSVDRRFERQRISEFESGRRSYSVAAMFGGDYRIGTSSVVGLALSRTRLSGDFSDGGGFEFDGRGVFVYGSWWLGERAFIDISGGADAQDRHSQRLVGLTTITEAPGRTTITIEPPVEAVRGNTSSRERVVELSGGFDFFVGTMTIGPRAGLAKRRIGIRAFTESGPTPMALAFDRQGIRSERTSLGVQASKAVRLERGTLVTQLNLDWLHEHEDDQRLITARFAEDLRPNPRRLEFLNQPPDRDWLNWRLSVVAAFSTRNSAFVSLEGMSGHEYLDRYAMSGGFRREF